VRPVKAICIVVAAIGVVATSCGRATLSYVTSAKSGDSSAGPPTSGDCFDYVAGSPQCFPRATYGTLAKTAPPRPLPKAAAVTRPPVLDPALAATGAKMISPDRYFVRGIDTVDSRLLVIDERDGVLRQSSDWGATWSTDKRLPAGLTWADVSKIVRFGGYLYMLATGPSPGVWRAAPAPGNTPFAWSAELLRLDRGSTAIMTDLDASSWGSADVLLCGEYGDPIGGPSIWRLRLEDGNSTGTAWERVDGPIPQNRHVHAVASDPYVPGQIWATIGDGGTEELIRSTDAGTTWRTVLNDHRWQGVEISFDRNFIYIASDQGNFTYEGVDRQSLTPYVGSPNNHFDFTPTASGAKYWRIAYFGAVDPVTGTYYCVANDTSSEGGPWMGMFFATKLSEPIQVLDRGGVGIEMNGEVFIAHDTVYSGIWQHPLVTHN